MKKIGITKSETVLLQAEVLDLKANYERRAEGVIMKQNLKKERSSSNSSYQKGTLRFVDYVSGSTCGKVRSMLNHEGEQVKEVTPSYAVEIQGLDEVCNAGDKLHSVESLNDARSVVEHRQLKQEVVDQKKSSKMTLEEFFKKTEEGTTNKELPIVLKTDVQGSIEAIRNVIEKVGNENVKARIIHSGVGGITENDVLLASASNAVILGFNVRPETKAIALAEREGTEVKTYQIIYELADDIKKALEGLLAPKKQEKYIGRAEIRALINVPKVGLIAGSYVVDGKIQRGAKMRLIREGKIILNDLKILSLKRFKDDAREVARL
jgi:translation initiation factor IF-2